VLTPGISPAFVMVKNVSAAENWAVWDNARVTYNVNNKALFPNTTSADTTESIDLLSNGFKIRDSSSFVNQSSTRMVYAAFAESPFKVSRAR